MNLKLLWYCTKAKDRRDYLYKLLNGYFIGTGNIDGLNCLNGKIVAESNFDCEEIIHTFENGASVHHDYSTKTLDNEQLLRKSRIFGQGLNDYLGDRNYDKNNNVVGYAIHIKNLNIFDEPKRLYDYLKSYSVTFDRFGHLRCEGLKRAPQNMCYAVDEQGNRYVIISVHPEWLCLILNGLKDVELRKKVLKEML